ncbi:MAG: PTS sugar transporter subunit IIA [Planctomycetota bacterium]
MTKIETTEYWKLFRPSACSLALKGHDQESIFDEILDVLVKAKSLDEALRDAARGALLQRERMASTGVGRNVAIPHVQLEGLETAVVGLSIHRDGVEWNALDGEPAHLFFTVLRPTQAGESHSPERHLQMMRWISGLSRDDDFRRFAMGVKNRTELVDLLKEKSSG